MANITFEPGQYTVCKNMIPGKEKKRGGELFNYPIQFFTIERGNWDQQRTYKHTAVKPDVGIIKDSARYLLQERDKHS